MPPIGTASLSRIPPPETPARADFPAAGAPNAHALVSVRWLAQLMAHADGRAPPPAAWGGGEFRVLATGWSGAGDAEAFAAGHLPGAVWLDTDVLETPAPQWRLRDPRSLQRALGEHGLSPGTCVILCSDQQIAAARAWWVLKYAGVRDVRILDGGLAAWRRAGMPVQCPVPAPVPRAFEAPVEHAMLATTADVAALLGGRDAWLADVRSRAEFAGHDSGYRYIEAAGRIPGALHVGDGDDSACLYVRADGHLYPPQRILARWQAAGILPRAGERRFAREVVFYCGGGWRSSLACFYAWLLGYRNIRNYSDGWSGWSTACHADPAARGATPGWRQRRTANPCIRALNPQGSGLV